MDLKDADEGEWRLETSNPAFPLLVLALALPHPDVAELRSLFDTPGVSGSGRPPDLPWTLSPGSDLHSLAVT